MQQIAYPKKVKIGGNKKVVLVPQDIGNVTGNVIFKKQVIRKDVLINMLYGMDKTGYDLFQQIMTDDNSVIVIDKIRQGFLYETIWELLISLKCIEGIDYTELCDGQLQSLSIITKIDTILRKKIVLGGNVSDVTIKQGRTIIPISIKYKPNFVPKGSDVNSLETTMNLITDDFKVGFIVKDKEIVKNHTYTNNKNIHKQVHDRVIENGLLFDEIDLIKGMEVFRERFQPLFTNIEDFTEMFDRDYLLNPRKQLVKWFHQKMNLNKIIKQILKGEKKILISQMPRSGKSILMLLLCKYLLENGRKRILIMTSIPATIDDFTNDLDNYLDFKHIQYIKQDEFSTIDTEFTGIIFCSVQYLKNDSATKRANSLTVKKTKKEMLKNIGFDAVFDDECHLGGSTDKTERDILNVIEEVKINIDIDIDIEDVYKYIPLTIFASGTSDKTVKFYKIKSSCNNSWEMTDVAYMKELLRPTITQTKKDGIIELMTSIHGPEFIKCFQNQTLNMDYSSFPTQVLMKYSIPQSLIDEIIEYNIKYKTNYGFSCATLFALYQAKNEESGVLEYQERFELAQTSEGRSILIEFFNCIISQQGMKKTIMREIEQLQFKRKSRQSTIKDPLLFITYLPTHTGNNNIKLLQRTIILFLKENDLWCDYNIEASNATEDTGSTSEKYNKFTQDCITRTKEKGKKGCILLLGSQGTTGITYPECDITISLDDGHNLDNQKQRLARSMTGAIGKTIGINVDMNIQRTYLYLMDVIQKHRKMTKTTKTNAEILYYLYEHNVFLFNPQQFNNGSMKITDIQSFYELEAVNLMKEIDDTTLLDELICDDDMNAMIIGKWQQKILDSKKANSELDGLQQDCPKGEKTGTEVDGPNINMKENNGDENDNEETEEEKEKIEVLVNQTLEMCKAFLIPLLALISRSYKIFDFKDIFTNEVTGRLIILLISKKIELNKDNYSIIINIMNTIIDNNQEIINNIREIYSIASPEKLRSLIEKHFIPSNTEKKQNAEIPTPVLLVEDMLDKIPLEFWTTPHKSFEPCCGKGNFVLGIFDRYDKGLKPLIPDNEERCRVIMTECIYYADLTPLNVFITTEIMKCHVQSCCGIEELEYSFNTYTGDTLKLDIKDKWDIERFDVVIGNPPYNSSGDTATGNTIWQDFTKQAINEWLLPTGYLLFVHPPGWRKPNTEKGKFYGLYNLMCIDNQMLYLEIHGIKDGKKVFNCGTRYDWYLIEKKKHYKQTIVIDEKREQNEYDLSKFTWLPNSLIDLIQKIIATDCDEKCPIIYNRSNYGSDNKKYISKQKNEIYKYEVIHTIPLNGVRYIYSSINDKGHFGISKVIFGDNGLNDAIIDMEGKYGMSENSMAIKVDNIEEAVNIKKALLSNNFKEIIKSCIIGNFRIDWRLFNEFKKDFWKEFI
jgi:hypothetical protein